MKIDAHIHDYFLFQNKAFTHEKILNIERDCSFSCPKDYKEFVTTYGAVSFNTSCYNDFLEVTGSTDGLVDVPDFTTAKLLKGGEERLLSVSLSDLYTPEQIMSTYLDFTKGPLVDGATTLFPAYLLPIGSCGGEDLFLLENEHDGGRVLYWEQVYDEWGTNGNVDLWHVADSFQEFIAGLEAD